MAEELGEDDLEKGPNDVDFLPAKVPNEAKKSGLLKLKKTFSNIKRLTGAIEVFKSYKGTKRKETESDAENRISSFQGIMKEICPDFVAKLEKQPDSSKKIALNKSLLVYFYDQSNKKKIKGGSDANIEYSYVINLLDDGADVNAPDIYGQTVLFEVAKSWDVDAAKFLVEYANVDLNHKDHYGHTALHVAASCNYSSMIKYLVSCGADTEAPTSLELQTPIFYAVKCAAVDAVETLIELQCVFDDIRDYRRRTPLFLAASNDRSESARILLRNGANSALCDIDYRPAIVPICQKMPTVAYDMALDQFHIKNRGTRKQHYHIGKMEPINEDTFKSRVWRNLLEIIIDNTQYKLLMHSAVQKFIEEQWRFFARQRAVGSILFQILYVCSWSIFGSYPDWDQRYKYNNLSVDVFRIINVMIAFALTIWQVVDEIKEYRHSSNWNNTRTDYMIGISNEDIEHCHPSYPGEKEYLIKEEQRIRESYKTEYFQDYWNYLDWLNYGLLIVCLLTHFADIAFHSLILARWHIRIFSVTVIFLWLRLMKVFQPFLTIGPFIFMLGKAIVALGTFILLYVIFFIPFAFASWMIWGGADNVNDEILGKYSKLSDLKNVTVERVTVKNFDTVYNMVFQLITLSLVDNYDYENMIKIDKYTSQLLLVLWLFTSAIMCLNLLIALLSDTFQRVYDNAQAVGVMQRAAFVNRCLFETMNNKYRKRWYRYLHENCDPLVMTYDDDESYVTSDMMTKKASEKAKTTLKNIKNFMDRHMATGDDDDDEDLDDSTGGSGPGTGSKANIYKTTVKNLNVVSGARFDKEMGQLCTSIQEIRKNQNEFEKTISEDVADLRESCKTIAAAVFNQTQQFSPPSQQISGHTPVQRRRARLPRSSRHNVVDAYNEDGSIFYSTAPDQ